MAFVVLRLCFLFDLTVWLRLLSAISLSGLTAALMIENAKQTIAYVIWNAIFSVAILLEKGFRIPNSFMFLKHTIHIYCIGFIYVTWWLAGIVLSTLYRGSNIDRIVSPIPTKRFETFDQIMQRNFTVHVDFRLYAIQ